MNKLLAMSTILLAMIIVNPVSASSVTPHCEIHTVNGFKGISDPLRPTIEEILKEKGYTIIQDGYLYKDYDVSDDDLEVREDLLKPKNLIGIFNGNPEYSDSTMCTKGIDRRTIFCVFNFYLYKVAHNQELLVVARVEKEIEKTPWFLGSEKEIVSDFTADVLATVKTNIPKCSKYL